MQTVAKLAERLDMSADEAVETLQKLRFDIAGPSAEISDEQTDILIDIDEDPSELDIFLKKVEKEEEVKRKKIERLQKAAAKKKAAAEKKKAAAAKKKAAAAKKKAAAEKKKAPAKKKAADKEEEVAADATEEAPESADAEAVAVKEAPEQVVEAEETAATPEVPVEAPEAAVIETEAPAEVVEPEVKKESAAPLAEILSDDDFPEVEAASEHKKEKSDGTHLLADAERHQEEIERRRQESLDARPMPTPDPDVVRKVIEQAQERQRKKDVPPPSRASREPRKKDKKAAAPTAAAQGAPEKSGGDRGGRPAPKRGKTAKKRKKQAERARAMEETMRRDAAAAVREFQAGSTLGSKRRKKKYHRNEDGTEEEIQMGGRIEIDDAMTPEKLAFAMNIGVNDIILALMDENVLVNKNQTIELDLVRKIAEAHDFEVELVIPEEEAILKEEPDDPEDLVLRAPVVTVMGHVDHGKTSFLDVVRRANVAEGEAGGITQHIAAYDVELDEGRVVFLDTPGHEAFTQMRARGAQVTDVVVLVVAADDGVKPQTIEAIDHAKAAEVPIVVAVNKCDKANAQPDRVRQELTQYELVSEEWGGKTIIKNISAQTEEGIDELLEMLVLESQMLELKANPNKRARGTIVESELTKGQGPVAWVLVQSGTLKVGDYFLAGETYGRVRTMMNSRGERIKEAGPSTPVVVTGFSAPPDAGDVFVTVEEERIARNVADKRALLTKQKRGPSAKHMTLEDFHARMEGAEQKTLNVIVKADVQGSVDVLKSTLAKAGNLEASVEVVHSGVGGVNESDIMLASASDAVILGFHVTANSRVKKVAEQEGVEIRTYRVIYELIDEVRQSLEGMLAPDKKEVITGHAEIRQVFRSSALGNIAGCMQIDGESARNAMVRLVRDDVVIYEGTIGTLRREKDDVRSVATGYECGIKLERYNDIQVGDIIETYIIEEIAKKLV